MVIPKVLQNDVITGQWTPIAKELLVFKLREFLMIKREVSKHNFMETPPKSEQILCYFASGFATMMS